MSTQPRGPGSHMARGRADSRRQPETDSSQEQATLPGGGIRPLSSPLWAPKDYTLKWSRDSGYWLLSWPCWGRSWTFFMAERGDGFEPGVCHSPRSHNTWIKPLSFCTSSRPHRFGFCGDRQLDLWFLFSYSFDTVKNLWKTLQSTQMWGF